jgi:hypothetical protein
VKVVVRRIETEWTKERKNRGEERWDGMREIRTSKIIGTREVWVPS